MSNRMRSVGLGAAVVVVAAVVAGAVVVGVVESRPSGSKSVVSAGGGVAVGTVEGRPHFVFRSAALDRDFGRVALVDAADPAGARAFTGLTCDRVDFAGGRGVCLIRHAVGTETTTRAQIFDSSYRAVGSVALAGFPSRTRVAPDGSWAATTDFVNGDSYATMGFSTRTDIIDLRTGTIAFDLETLLVSRGGQAFAVDDPNYWGVSWLSDSRHFYATLGSEGTTYLIEGDVATRKAVVVTTGVECPSLSPDGSRIAFKSRVRGPTVTWRLSVLDLATLQTHALAEVRDVDDQAEWLDDSTVMYGLPAASSTSSTSSGPSGPSGPSANLPGVPVESTGSSIATDTWTVPADGSGHSHLLLRGAWSTELLHS